MQKDPNAQAPPTKFHCARMQSLDTHTGVPYWSRELEHPFAVAWQMSSLQIAEMTLCELFPHLPASEQTSMSMLWHSSVASTPTSKASSYSLKAVSTSCCSPHTLSRQPYVVAVGFRFLTVFISSNTCRVVQADGVEMGMGAPEGGMGGKGGGGGARLPIQTHAGRSM